MPKYVRYAIAAVFCFAVMAMAAYAFDGNGRPTATVQAWRSDMYASYTLSERQQGLEIQGEIPEVLESFGPAYAYLNSEIVNVKSDLIDGTRRVRARSINFTYEVHYADNVVSLVIMATTRAVTDRISVASVNFDPRTGTLLNLTAAMGMDITPLAEGIIAEMIRRNPETYYAAFNAPPTGQAFYMTNSHLVLLFNEFQLSSAPDSTREIRFVRNNIRTFTIGRNDYRISPDRYEIKMMPLRQILENMGYSDDNIRWHPSDNEAVIIRNDSPFITLRPGENNFEVNGVLQRSLEAAPELRRGNMYVPISFFNQIMGLTAYNIDEDGNITFMTYTR